MSLSVLSSPPRLFSSHLSTSLPCCIPLCHSAPILILNRFLAFLHLSLSPFLPPCTFSPHPLVRGVSEYNGVNHSHSEAVSLSIHGTAEAWNTIPLICIPLHSQRTHTKVHGTQTQSTDGNYAQNFDVNRHHNVTTKSAIDLTWTQELGFLSGLYKIN